MPTQNENQPTTTGSLNQALKNFFNTFSEHPKQKEMPPLTRSLYWNRIPDNDPYIER